MENPRFPWQIPPFLVEGRHHTIEKEGIWSRGYAVPSMTLGNVCPPDSGAKLAVADISVDKT